MKIKSLSPSLLIVGHGSSFSKGAEQAARKHADTLRRKGNFQQVIVHFLKGGQPVPALPEGDIFLFPFFMTGGYTVETKIPTLLDLGQFKHDKSKTRIYQCEALGVHKMLAQILKKMAQDVCDQHSYKTRDTQVVLFAHGSGKSEDSFLATKVQADRLRQVTDFASITSVFLEQAPYLHEWLDENASVNKPVIVLGVFAADGPHSAVDVPLAIAEWEKKRRLEGAEDVPPIHYAGAVGTRLEIAELIQQSVAERINLV